MSQHAAILTADGRTDGNWPTGTVNPISANGRDPVRLAVWWGLALLLAPAALAVLLIGLVGLVVCLGLRAVAVVASWFQGPPTVDDRRPSPQPEWAEITM